MGLHTSDTAKDRLQHAEADRLSDVLLAIETVPAHTFRLTPLAVGLIPVVSIQLGDHRWRLSPGETRTLARCLTWDGGGRHTGLLASIFHSAACDAEALACPVAAARRAELIAAGAA